MARPTLKASAIRRMATDVSGDKGSDRWFYWIESRVNRSIRPWRDSTSLTDRGEGGCLSAPPGPAWARSGWRTARLTERPDGAGVGERPPHRRRLAA